MSVENKIMSAIKDWSSSEPMTKVIPNRTSALLMAMNALFQNDNTIETKETIAGLLDNIVLEEPFLVLSIKEINDMVTQVVNACDIIDNNIDIDDEVFLINQKDVETYEVVPCKVKLIRYIKNESGSKLSMEFLIKPIDDDKTIQGIESTGPMDVKIVPDAHTTWVTMNSANLQWFTDKSLADDHCDRLNDNNCVG